MSDDPLQKYLEEVGRQPLLATADEKRLSRLVRDADGAELGLSAASPDERAKLETLVQEGRKAKETLVRSNLRLVVAIAKGYSAPAQPLPTLIQEGNLGLIRAVDYFEPSSQMRFSEHAKPFIRRAIESSIA